MKMYPDALHGNIDTRPSGWWHGYAAVDLSVIAEEWQDTAMALERENARLREALSTARSDAAYAADALRDQARKSDTYGWR